MLPTNFDSKRCEVPVPATRMRLNRRDAEKSIIELMTLGNPHLITVHYNKNVEMIREVTAARFSAPSPTHAKYQTDVLIALACKAAIETGVSSEKAHTISALCSTLCETADAADRHWEITHDILMHFCEAIQAAQLDGFSSTIRQCCEYIHGKIHGNVSLEELSQLCHLSPHYVSDLFRKELGLGALQYAHQEKMRYAKFLLENSRLTISEISSMLSYPSHSNFSQRFKRTYGVTPNEYRAIC